VAELMAKKAETCPIYLIRTGDKLMGEMEMDRDAVRRFPAGERIRVDVRTGRVPSRLRFYWAFLHQVVKATECCPTAEALHELVKLETGYTDKVRVRGHIILVPRSISFSAMAEEEFTTFLANAERFIAETFGISPADVEQAA
jgi:hypothetical protein